MQSLMILGRQPGLGLAELESLYGSSMVKPLGADNPAALVDVDPCLLAFDRLGGSIKFCKLLTVLDTINWGKVERFLVEASPSQSQNMPDGKMTLGLSLHGFNMSLKRIESTGLKIKKAVKKTGRPVRLVPNKALSLNSAQVIHNKLTGPNGWELVFVVDGTKTYIAQTVKVQDIDAYTARDRQRPKRDSRVGMLPPKLAQIIINLATGRLSEDKLSSVCEIPEGQPVPAPVMNACLLDPFCGSGVILQEALIMGYEVMGSDISSRMCDYSQQNLEWLNKKYDGKLPDYEIFSGDAASYKWPAKFNLVASETYLGRPFTSQPDPETLQRTISECNLIIKKFLRNLHGQLQTNTRLCLAIPCWRNPSGSFKFLPLIDQLSDLGYNRVSFEHSGNDQLIYYREGQIVGRQLLVISKE